ncbi:MAG TPA: GDP-L-fucose synthase [Phycisphaerales bacterium]|nr:GDP-L-fucose synthase [Phycisphaerales bacterium]
MSSGLNSASILLTGGAGFLGKAVQRVLRARGVNDSQIAVPRQAEFDLTSEGDVELLYEKRKPEVVIHLAAEVGGIGANMQSPGRFFFANMAMSMHLIEGARKHGVRKFVQVGTICSYPKFCPVPFSEENLWAGYPEETNAPYGIAKKAAGVMLDAYCRQYGLAGAYVLPVNLYGPHDNFDPRSSHVIPALIRKCVEAQEQSADHIMCWGTGSASREFLYVDDAAEGIVLAAEKMSEPTPINLGTGMEISIRELVQLIARLTGFTGEIRWDSTKPDGQPRRCLDTRKAEKLLGFKAKVGFEKGLKDTIEWYRSAMAGQGR